MPERTNHVQFRASQELAGSLAARASGAMTAGEVARQDLARYYAAIALTLADLELSDAEASLVVDALNGCLASPESAPYTARDIREAINTDGLADKWAVDGRGLWDRIGAHPFIGVALADAAERYWTSTTTHPEYTHRQHLAIAGLIAIRWPRDYPLSPSAIDPDDQP